MSSAFINKYKEYIIEQYVNEKKSTYEIAQDLKTYPNKIRRALNTLGVDLRDKSSAQTVAIESGRHEHPTRGKKRTEAEKVAISNGMATYWENMEEDERKRRSDLSKKQWAEMSEEDKANLRKLAAEAVRKASKEGSKIEKFIYEGLTKVGYDVIFHKRGLVANENLEVDWKYVANKIGVSEELPFLGASNTSKESSKTREEQQNLHWSDFYMDLDTIKDVSKFYRRDIDIFQYNDCETHLLRKQEELIRT